MPITRRRRVNPPDQPENNNNHVADQTENAAEAPAADQPTDVPADAANDISSASPATPPEPASAAEPSEQVPPGAPFASPSGTPSVGAQFTSPSPTANGERAERVDRQEYTPLPSPVPPPETTGRRTSFRRPSQMSMPPAPPPMAPPVPPPMTPPPLPTPTHEIGLPLGNLLHLAYNPGYTGADEARSLLLRKLAQETKAGGRARCWNCGSLAIAYDHWNTRSKNFGEVGVAFCEICGVWSVM